MRGDDGGASASRHDRQAGGFSYEDLSFQLCDSNAYRNFCRLSISKNPPTASTLQKNIKRVTGETWEGINRMLVDFAKEKKIETGKKVRTDTTVVESNIHAPSDSSLLCDCVRVMARLMGEAKEAFGVEFKNHTRRAKRRAMGILNAGTNEERLPLYLDLLNVTKATMTSASRIAQELAEMKALGPFEFLRARAIAKELAHYVELARQVVSQTERRVVNGESVPALEKVVSIFEPHTDIIVKDRRQTLYGHKICLSTGASGIVTDVVVEEGNPSDSTLAVKMIQRYTEIFGAAPVQAAFDGGFTSKDNLLEIKKLGVLDVAFSKGRGLPITERVRDIVEYRLLRNFRAGIEGVISFLKRSFGWTRCVWSGWDSFRAYVFGSPVACNLRLMERRLLGK